MQNPMISLDTRYNNPLLPSTLPGRPLSSAVVSVSAAVLVGRLPDDRPVRHFRLVPRSLRARPQSGPFSSWRSEWPEIGKRASGWFR